MKNKPTRIQRNRRTIQQSPNSLPVIYVGRPGKWGNPFKLENGKIYVQNRPPRSPAARIIKPKYLYICDGDMDVLLRIYKSVLTGRMQSGEYNIIVENLKLMLPWVDYYSAMKVTELANKNLSCWCHPGAPCHADILLDLANSKKKS